jgi:hypothetical protein
MLEIFADVYNTYFSKIEALLKYNRNPEHIDRALLKICRKHSENNLTFFSSFGASFTEEKGMLDFVKHRVDEWIQPLFDGIDRIVFSDNQDLDFRFAQLQIKIHALQAKVKEARGIGHTSITSYQVKNQEIEIAGGDTDSLINDLLGPDPVTN